MTLAKPRPGACLMMGLKGPRLSSQERDFIISRSVAGLVLFKRNIVSLPQVRKLCRDIKSLSNPSPLIAVDAEGGRVNRFSHLKECPPFPPPRLLSSFSPDRILSLGKALGGFLKAVGVDVNFAPCLDLPTKNSPLLKDRLWGRSVEEILNKALCFASALAQSGIVPCFKHFPGHGGVMEDSHKELPQDGRSLKKLKKQLNLFYNALKKQPGWIMAGHVAFPLMDKKPAVFSPFFLKKLLRGEAGFQGIVISDDIDMGALSAWSPEERFFLALKGGCDIVLSCQYPETAQKILTSFEKHPDTHKALEKELETSSQRILKFRRKGKASSVS